MTELDVFRKQKDQFFKYHPQSPLLPEQQQQFEGLHYFPPDPALRFELPIDEFPTKDQVLMQTSTGELRTYTRYGRLRFRVNGQGAELTLYADGETLFLPFADALAGSETYAAGRYLEPQLLDNGTILVDFNLAYNPYCAYNDAWSCPLTPAENRLAVPIRAGEQRFVVDEAHVSLA